MSGFPQVAPSVLSADFGVLREQVSLVQEAGAEEVSTQQDLAGLDRVVLGKKRALETPA